MSFDTPDGLNAKFRRDAAQHAGPQAPREARGCSGCGRAWDAMPPTERGAAALLCLPCYHAGLGGAANGDGICNRADCPRHGGGTP